MRGFGVAAKSDIAPEMRGNCNLLHFAVSNSPVYRSNSISVWILWGSASVDILRLPMTPLIINLNPSKNRKKKRLIFNFPNFYKYFFIYFVGRRGLTKISSQILIGSGVKGDTLDLLYIVNITWMHLMTRRKRKTACRIAVGSWDIMHAPDVRSLSYLGDRDGWWKSQGPQRERWLGAVVCGVWRGHALMLPSASESRPRTRGRVLSVPTHYP